MPDGPEIEQRPPPSNVVREAKSIAATETPARVKVEPNGDKWRVRVDGHALPKGTVLRGPPSDVMSSEWDDTAPELDESGFSEFAEDVKDEAGTRTQITTNYSRASNEEYWRITINYGSEWK